jgi:hypothetical protein
MRNRSHVLPALIAVLASTIGFAQNPNDATRMFEEGRELAKQEKWAEACASFSASLALDPAPGTKLNLGECLEKQGKFRAGWLMFEEAARDFDRTGDKRAEFARERAKAAEAQLATLVIKLAEPARAGLLVNIGDRLATPQSEIVERVDPGTIDVIVTAPARERFSQSVTLATATTTVVDVPVLAEIVVPPPTNVAPAVTDEGTHRQRKRVYIAYALGATGAASLITSVVLGYVAKNQYDSAFDDAKCFDRPDKAVCNAAGQSAVDSAQTKADVATGFLIGGVALGAAGIVVYLTAPKERSVVVTPVAGSSTVGASLQLSF